MGCSVSGDTLQYRLKEGVSHWSTRQATQMFTYLLMQRRTSATPTSVCLLMSHYSARRPQWRSTIAQNLDKYVFLYAMYSPGERLWIDSNGKNGN